jgi:Family of unknown function (DUF6461)
MPKSPADDDDYSAAWVTEGLRPLANAYCVTVIHNVDQNEALRRFGAHVDHIATSTWAELLAKAADNIDSGTQVAAAFALGTHALLVELNGFSGLSRPDWSTGTFAVSAYVSTEGDSSFAVSHNGVFIVGLDEIAPGLAPGPQPNVLGVALAQMGIHAADEPGGDVVEFLDGLELLCRVAGVRPTISDITGSTRVATFPYWRRPSSTRT